MSGSEVHYEQAKNKKGNDKKARRNKKEDRYERGAYIFHISFMDLINELLSTIFHSLCFLIHVFLYLYCLLSQNPNFVAWKTS